MFAGEAKASPVIVRKLPGLRDLLALAAHPQRYPCLLESVAHGTPSSRWDLLLAFPQQTLCLQADGHLMLDGVPQPSDRFLPALNNLWQAERTTASTDEWPFHGGWAMYLAYELAGQIEPRLRLPACSDQTPVAVALRCPAAVLYDHQNDCTVLLAEVKHADLLDEMHRDLDMAQAVDTALPELERLDEDEPAHFLDAVAQVHAYLACGDVFQANLSRAWRAGYKASPAPTALYAALRRTNPAPFAALWQQPGWAMASSSPERLVEVRAGQAETRPIAGTRPREPGDDDAMRIRELSDHPKERAEHIMLVDLERNDLGRICRPGSVRVSELMTVESYAHVHHLVSNVCGRLREGVTPGQVIAAVFPGGTITGCPKVRCMEIIAELEGEGRGAYTGAVGYLDRNGDMDLNILIRSLTIAGREVCLRAGAGIVVDSVAERELEETHAKARGLLNALESAHEPAYADQRPA
ncbi:MAG TPA: aminodeoxychorismate synthase component I [Oleiagrimonas sp.]|nr:aminodeoxychorismate synthase component I [Oleiagrimonas sp.]